MKQEGMKQQSPGVNARPRSQRGRRGALCCQRRRALCPQRLTVRPVWPGARLSSICSFVIADRREDGTERLTCLVDQT